MTLYKGKGKYVVYSGGPSCDTTPHSCHEPEKMSDTIPNKPAKMSYLGDSAFMSMDPRFTDVPEFDPTISHDASPPGANPTSYQRMVAYGASPNRPESRGANIALGGSPDAIPGNRRPVAMKATSHDEAEDEAEDAVPAGREKRPAPLSSQRGFREGPLTPGSDEAAGREKRPAPLSSQRGFREGPLTPGSDEAAGREKRPAPLSSQRGFREGPLTPGHDAEDEAEDAEHPIRPFHQVLRGEKFSPRSSRRSDGTRINVYSRENPGGGGHETVELHHHQPTGKVKSITRSGHEGAVLSHSENTSPEKMHRNIHEASYRPPAGMPKAHTAAQIKEYQGAIKAKPAAKAAAAPATFGAKPPRSRDEAVDDLEGD